MVASRLQLAMPAYRGAERLWRLPPAFLAPCLRSPFSTAPALAKERTMKQLRRMKKNQNKDLYTIKLAEARRKANLARQEVLQQVRKEAMGDPIHGIETDFVKSFDTAIPSDPQSEETGPGLTVKPVTEEPDKTPQPPSGQTDSSSNDPKSDAEPTNRTAQAQDTSTLFTESHLIQNLTRPGVLSSIQSSHQLLDPVPPTPLPSSTDQESSNPRARETHNRENTIYTARKSTFDAHHTTASTSLNRILAVSNASSKQRTQKNIARIIEKLGRHNTDGVVAPKATARLLVRDTATSPSPSPSSTPTPPTPTSPRTYSPHPTPSLPSHPPPLPRGGPDTGSSEVQIGILTAKIRVLAQRYEGRSRQDKVNKRNLLLLLHRRQRLLKYMERKERGSGRWERMVGLLGLGEGCWRGQIEVR